MVFNSKLIDFFQKHNLYDKDMFDYFSINSTMIDYKNPEHRSFIGCFYIFDKNNRLKNIHLTIPYIYDDITMLISIHEIVHAIMLYKKLNRKVTIGIDKEILPMLYEKIYINECNNVMLNEFDKEINNSINRKKDKSYLLGLELRDILIDEYKYDINDLNKKVKKLVKTHK